MSRVHQSQLVAAAERPVAICEYNVAHVEVMSPNQIMEQKRCEAMYPELLSERYWQGAPCSVPVTFRRPSSIACWCAHG
jgi:hypothetical protein